MPPVDSETIGRRVAQARERANLTQVELARAAGVDRSALSKIEAGTRRLTALELARIAEATGEPFDWFVTEPPPAVVSYRNRDGSTTSSIDQRLEKVARDLALLQSLGALTAPKRKPSSQPESPEQASRLATQARTAMGLDQTAPIVDLVSSVVRLGLFPFAWDLGTDAPDAATTLLGPGAVTVINSSRAVGRRRLALAHELGHFLLADEYTVDWRVGSWTERERIEWLLDGFGRALLLPAAAVKRRWKDLRASHSTRDAAVLIASDYRVDMSTLAVRLLDLDVANEGEAADIRATTTTRSDIIEHNLVVPNDLDGVALPREYEKAVLSLYRAERISAERAVDLLYGTLDESGLPQLPPVAEGEIWKFVS